jgi:O-antigen/teichoic acid export membrane protein
VQLLRETNVATSTEAPDAASYSGVREFARSFLQDGVRNHIVTGAAGIFASRLTFSGLSFLLSILLARILGVSGFGIYTYSFAWVVLLTIPGMLGMDQLLVREIAGAGTRGSWDSIRDVLRTANRVVLLASVVLIGAGGLSAYLLIRRTDPQMYGTFLLALLLLPLITLTRVRQCALQGLHRVVLGVLPEMILQPVLLIASLGIGYWIVAGRLRPAGAMGCNVLSYFIAFLIGTGLLLKNIPREEAYPAREHRKWNWKKSALPLMFAASAGVIYGQADTLMLGMIKGSSAVGIYSIADRGSELVQMLLIVVSTALAPKVASLYASGDIQRLEKLVVQFGRLTLLFSLPIAVVMIGFGYWYIWIFYGPAFIPGQSALAILSAGKILTVAMGLPGMILIMTGHEKDTAFAIGVSAIITILLNLELIPRWGLEGTAISTAATTVLWNVLMTILVYKRLGIHSTALGRLSLRKAVA